jgi:hypothetical protein
MKLLRHDALDSVRASGGNDSKKSATVKMERGKPYLDGSSVDNYLKDV